MTRRRFRLLLFYLVAVLPLIGWGASQAMQTNANSPIDWVSDRFEPRAEYDRFREAFGAGDVVVVSWPGCTVDAESLDIFVDVLQRAPAFFDENGEWSFESVVTGRAVLRELTRGSLTRDEALRRLRGTLIGPDGETTCAIVTFTAEGLQRRERLVRFIEGTLSRYCKVPTGDWHMAGPVMDGLSVDVASRKALDRFAVPSSVIVLLVCWGCLRNLPAALLVFGMSLLCQGATLALVHFSGETMSALLIVMPPLIQVLAVASGIHLTNYCVDAAERHGDTVAAERHGDTVAAERHGDTVAAAREAVQSGWLPCVLSAGTTAIGLASLMVSEMTPIRQFGAYGAAGVALTSGLVLAVIPGVFAFWPRIHNARRLKPAPPGSVNTALDWSVLARGLQKSSWLVSAVALGAMFALAFGLPKLQTSVRIETLFPDDSEILSDYRWLEEHVAPLVPIEVVLRFEPECELSFAEKLRLVDRVETELAAQPDVGGTSSAATSVPSELLAALRTSPGRRDEDPDQNPTADQGQNPAAWSHQTAMSPSEPGLLSETADHHQAERAVAFIQPAVALIQLEQTLRDVRTSNRSIGRRPAKHAPDRLADDDLWRITARVSALDETDYAEFLDRVRASVDPLILDRDGQSLRGVSAEFTGIMPLVHGIQRQLINDLFASFVGALVLIAIVMTLVQGGIMAGLVSMVSNLFPIVLMFGLLGWLRVPMDIGSVTTASVALGIAVDDTLHFLTFFRRGLDAGLSRFEAVLDSYRHCGRAKIQTSLICSLGLLAFAASDFVPTARFAWMMAALLGAALFGDLIVLPSLLLGPLGRFFDSGTACASVSVERERTPS
ncbi:MAG: MMPL family transporter [Planctomycetota bacterium]|nr:MMPL family transporter [Planctomycetota bacterium]